MATSQTINASAKHQSPELSSSVIGKDYLAAREQRKEVNQAKFDIHCRGKEVEAGVNQTFEPLMDALRSVDSRLWESDPDTDPFWTFFLDLSDVVWTDKDLRDGLHTHLRQAGYTTPLNETEKLNIGAILALGFLGGVRYSGVTGATLSLEMPSEEVING